MNELINGNAIKMTSIEIAELVGIGAGLGLLGSLF